ncbi:hypothetical protein CMQ_7256 [Grosmannia clavigera kw1407]|uniref:Six-bladed beta-propeller-like protein n=1 Tax=Grosmannia clavigera (strain kw1407 / UAMH 11150) TaxID=655863 RepID=F0XQD9_GROCL|nr:uncharacterized protein CMQ_7256 [Grosmannia clavigera kw1407]EFX00254.1 hypothetical protein CMQ_7256 [Grosmannia clavigera kw1407]
MQLLSGLLGLAAVASTTLAAVSKSSPPAANVSVLTTFSFPSWAENLAVRASGEILVSRLEAPAVYQIDPATGAATLVYAWDASAYKGCLGIAEMTTDVFYVITSAFIDDDFVKQSGINSIFEVDMRAFVIGSDGVVTTNATVRKLVDVPEADFLNGMAVLDDSYILVSDVYAGEIYKIDTATANYSVVISDPLMKFDYASHPPTNLGSNGIKIHDGCLYWTNTAAGFLARIAIDAGANPIGSSAIAVTGVPKADDFFIRSDGVAFICQNQMDTLSVAYLDNSASTPAYAIAGSNTSTILAGVTAAKFGRRSVDESTLYLSTSGALALAINGSVVVAGTISSIDTTLY